MAFHYIRFRQHITSSKFFRVIAKYCFSLSNLLLARLVNRPVVLCFHRIKKSSGSLLDKRVSAIDPDSFEKVINYLRVLGYKFISLEHLVDRILEPRLERVAVITFDDGFKDLYQNAYPILKKYDIPFTLFLITSNVDSKRLLWLHKLYISIENISPLNRVNILRKHIDLHEGNEDLNNIVSAIVYCSDKNVIENLASNMANEGRLSIEKERLIAEKLYLTKGELLEMAKHGLTIEAHGHEHWPLANLNQAETDKEISSSVKYIMQELYRMPRFYCLPFGIGNQFVKDIVKDLDLSGIATTHQRLVKAFEDTYSLPRISVLDEIGNFYRELSREYLKDVLGRMHLKSSNKERY